MYALVDCNNFYASCERVFRPDLRGKPVVVLSNNDGCVIARSNEAKAKGIPMGAPAFMYEKVFEQEKIHVFSANFTLYGDMSQRVMSILSDFIPEMEIYSIDEAFLLLNGYQDDLQQLGLNMRQKVLQWTDIPISVGMAPTKALSKVANRIAKKFTEQTGGVYIIDNEDKRIKALKWLKIEDVWGIGRQLAKKLNERGVVNAWDFTQIEDAWVRKHLSVVGLRLKHELEGKPTLELDEVKAKKNIATTRTFDNNYTDFEYIKERVSTFAVTCAEKLRAQNSVCSSITVFLRTNRHRDDMEQYRCSIDIKLPFPSNSAIEITRFAVSGFRQIFREGYAYKKAGVILGDFTPVNEVQLNLFENSDPKHGALMQTLDKLNKHYGQQKIKLGSQDLKRTWKMKQERLSQRYTTRLDEIITVKANQ